MTIERSVHEGPALLERWQCRKCSSQDTIKPCRLVIEEEIPIRDGKQVSRAIYLCLSCAKAIEGSL